MNSHSRIKKVTEHYYNLKEYFESEMKWDNNLVPTVSIVHRYFEDGRKIETAKNCINSSVKVRNRFNNIQRAFLWASW